MNFQGGFWKRLGVGGAVLLFGWIAMPVVAANTIWLGDMLYNSPRDMAHIKINGCTLGYNKEHRYFFCKDGGGTGGGDITLTHGARVLSGSWEEEVTTVAGEATIETTNVLPASAIVDRCTGRTTSDISGGYTLGVNGDATAYGTLAGVAGETTDEEQYISAPSINTLDQPVIIFSTPGSFADNTGRVRIACFYRVITASTK